MKTVLIVDDSPLVRRVVKASLKEGDYQCEEASNGKDALKQLLECEFDLIVSDLNMPGMTGLEMLQHIREKMPRLKTPIIMLTSDSKIESVRQAKNLGVAGWIIKPFTPELFLQTLNKVFGVTPTETK